MTARPARIKEIIDVPFGYPRDEALQERAEFVALRSHIRELVMSEYRAQPASKYFDPSLYLKTIA